ncbi:zinc ribbon domain-containing protein [Anaerosalibacter bizertensis]|uniref:zinc ribbon domain-containing protein n=1 Tax=Anaerosalibacter bizertensis TaxID=932217 RepID=UPI001C0E9843|nr:zinc ribbon domain-containing protein [Anaerosalibacter bizertensis]MBU5292914.1 zinc ribbon domain-containing protein [Anaerosalibacter bizertensis]
MANIRYKFQKGIKKIQDGFSTEKTKFQTSQEILSLEERVSKNEEERLELIISLGEKYYMEYREDKVKNEEISNIGLKIAELDKKIYHDLKTIEEKTKTQDLICECGTPLTSKDKFCKNCGKKVELQEKENIESIECPNCEEEIPLDSSYCICCGIKLD